MEVYVSRVEKEFFRTVDSGLGYSYHFREIGKAMGFLVEVNIIFINPLSANPTKWSNTLKQFVGNLPMNCLSVFDHFVILSLKGLKR